MMFHAQIAARAFNAPLLVEPSKAMAFLAGLGPRITGQQVRLAGLEVALCLSQTGAEPAGDRCGAAEYARPGGGLEVKNRTRPGFERQQSIRGINCREERADFPAGAAGQTAQAVGSGAGRIAGGGWGVGVDPGELG